MNNRQRLAYRPDEAAQLLGVSRDIVFRLLRAGELRSIKIGRCRVIPADALVEFIAEAEAAGEVKILPPTRRGRG